MIGVGANSPIETNTARLVSVLHIGTNTARFHMTYIV